ncbi:hypothetical protein HDU79_011529, partial [Rhizoclosmatium sp. JEL0117]
MLAITGEPAARLARFTVFDSAKRYTINCLNSSFGKKKAELNVITNMENLLQGFNNTPQEIEFK